MRWWLFSSPRLALECASPLTPPVDLKDDLLREGAGPRLDRLLEAPHHQGSAPNEDRRETRQKAEGSHIQLGRGFDCQPELPRAASLQVRPSLRRDDRDREYRSQGYWLGRETPPP